MVTEDMLERYIQLEEEIALAEKNSPSMVLQQKRTQVNQLARRIMEQQELVKALEAETYDILWFFFLYLLEKSCFRKVERMRKHFSQ